MEENTNNVKNSAFKPHNKRGTVRSQTWALSKLTASINKLVDINAKRLKVEKDDRLALLKFRKVEPEENWKHEKEKERACRAVHRA